MAMGRPSASAARTPRWAYPSIPLGETGDHVHTRAREAVPEVARRLAAGCGGVASADDANPPPIEQRERTAGEEHRRRQRVVEQQRRVLRAAMNDDLHPQLLAAAPDGLGITFAHTSPPGVAHLRLGEHPRGQAMAGTVALHHLPRLGGSVVAEQRTQPVNGHLVEPGQGSRIGFGREASIMLPRPATTP